MKLNIKTSPKLVSNKDLKVTTFDIMFVNPRLEFEDKYALEILLDLMSMYSLKNRTRQAFNEANDLNYIANYDVDFFNKGDTQFLTVSFLLPMTGIFDDFDLKKSLKIVKNHIFKSVVLADDFSYEFNLAYERYQKKLETKLSDPMAYFNDFWKDLYDFKHNYYHTNNDHINALKNTTMDRVRELYEKLILKGTYITFIGGNISDKTYYKETFESIFKQRKEVLKTEVDYERKFKPDWFGHVDKKIDSTQSIIRVGYYKENATKRDRYLLMFLSCALWRRENHILFNKLRNENDLVYSCSADYIESLDTITCTAHLSKENINKALVLIDESINELLDEEKFNNAKEKLLKADNITFISYLDDKLHEIKRLRSNTFKFETFEDEYNELTTITYEEMKECIESLKKVAELIMVGDKND